MSKRIMIVTLDILFVLTACSGNPTIGSTLQPTNTPDQQTPVPTITPTPTPEVRYSAGEAYLLSGDYDAAYNEFQLTSTQSDDPELIASSILGMGRALLQKRDYFGAYDQFSYLLNNFPSGESRNSSFFFLARAYEALDQPRLAADAYASYLAALPGPLDSEINEMRGNALMEYGDYPGAVTAFETALLTASGSRIDQLQLELAQAATAAGDTARAIDIYLAVNETSQSDHIKAKANLLWGQIYIDLGQPEQAYARYQDSVKNYPEAFDTFSALVQLVNGGQSVNQLQRANIDYNIAKIKTDNGLDGSEQYSLAIQAIDSFFQENPENHDSSPHIYKALSLFGLGNYEGEIAEWNKVIQDHSTEEEYYYMAFDEKSNTQWFSLLQYEDAVQTSLDFVASVPTSPNAPKLLDKAARIYVDGNYLSLAAAIYERLFNEYPGSEFAYSSLFKAGILYFRTNDYLKAQLTFQRLIVLTENPADQAAANLWVAKSLEKQGKSAEATEYYQKAADADPNGYYSIRAGQILNGQSPFPSLENIDLAVDFKTEKIRADRWVQETFQINPSIDLSSPGELAANTNWQRAEVFYKLDMRDEARNEFEALRVSLEGDVVNTYRLLNRTLELGFYHTATFASRHILDLAGLSQAATLTEPPIYFNHIRFGSFYREIIVPTALEHEIDPMLIFSIIRQESMFDSSITSVAGAQGLMQMLPDTGLETAELFGWPENYSTEDLNRPMVNVRLGTHYFRRWLDYYDGSFYAALSSYNAGPNVTVKWNELSGGDSDLFLELITSSETKDYIKSIVENYYIYKSIYTR